MYDQYQKNDDQMNQQQDQQPDQPLPQYAEIQGQKIFMGGLDYSLLQKQKQQDKKLGLLSNIRNQLFNMEKKIDSRTVRIDPSKPIIDQQSIKLIQSIKNLQNIKPLVNSSTFYLFDTKYHFGKQTPQVITKRLGRMNKQATYMKVTPQMMNKFKKILQKPDVDLDKMRKDKAIRKLVQNDGDNNSSQSDSEDNIFGSDSQDNGSQKNEKQTKLFNFGQKLSLSANDQDIFAQKRTINLTTQQDNQQKIQLSATPQQKDKYEFMRKKVKKITTQQQVDEYGECYIQTGPTFEQMKQYRAQGIQIWGDLKQFKKVQKKQNVNRDYHMVKRIIDEKSKKK